MVIDTEDGCYIPACGSGQVKCLKNLRNEAFPTTIVKAIASDVEPESSLLDAAEEAVEEAADYIRAGEYSWASTLEQRWLARDGGAHSVRGKPVAKYASLRHSKQRTQAEMWLSCTDIEQLAASLTGLPASFATVLRKVDRWALVAFVRACVESGELQIADNWTRKLLKIADSGKLHLARPRTQVEDVSFPPCRAGVVDSDSASRQKEAEDNLVALVAARATLAKGAEIEGGSIYSRLWADKSKDFEELLKEMQAVRVRPRAEAFNHLIKAKVDRHSMDAAADWMQRMAEFRSTPNAATYRMLITSSAVSSSASEAEGWLVAMYQSRLHVPESCVATVVEKYSEDRRPAAAEATLRRALARGIEVGWTTSAAVLRAHVRAGRAETAEKWLEEVKDIVSGLQRPLQLSDLWNLQAYGLYSQVSLKSRSAHGQRGRVLWISWESLRCADAFLGGFLTGPVLPRPRALFALRAEGRRRLTELPRREDYAPGSCKKGNGRQRYVGHMRCEMNPMKPESSRSKPQ
ncbi:unnamed protein product [Symbiodinium sp. KB8]|nr:unnamed protein product [Symbiodinium sp. KB8]